MYDKVIDLRKGVLASMAWTQCESDKHVDELNVLIVANFTGDDASSNNRFNELARRFTDRGATVELVTSDFSHARKARRSWDFGDVNYRITRISEPGYRNNVSLARLRSQASFARSLRKYLNRRAKAPDVILAAVPPPAVGSVCAKYGSSRGIPVVIDIQDLWPEAFRIVARAPWVVDAAFWPMRRVNRQMYRSTTLIVGVSQTYIQAAKQASPSRTDSAVVYLGTDLDKFDLFAGASSSASRPERIRVAYVGGLSRSYDLPTVIDALALLAEKRPDLGLTELVVMGDGASRQELESRAREAGIRSDFRGKLPYPEMVRTLVSCDVAVNPIVRGAAQSITNKVCDYAAAGLPVVNTQESSEYRGLIERYGAGINCEPESAEDVAAALANLIDDPVTRESMGRGNRKLAEQAFNRAVTYEDLIDRLISASRDSRLGA